MLFLECGTLKNINWARRPCLGNWINDSLVWHISSFVLSCLVSLYRGHLSILSVHVLPFVCFLLFRQVRSAARKRWHRWQDHHSLRVRVARAMSIPTSPTRISFHSIKQTAAVWNAPLVHAQRGGLQGFSFFTLPKPLSSNFLPLFCTALSQWGAHHIFVDSHLPYSWCCFKPNRQKPLGVGAGKTDSKKKEIQHWLHFVEIHSEKSKPAHWQEQSFFFPPFFLFCFSFRIMVNEDYF